MGDPLKKGLPKKYLVEDLRNAISAEQTAGDFFRYISEQIRNGRTKNRFKQFADEETKINKRILQTRLREIVGNAYKNNHHRLDIFGFSFSVKTEWFSLFGALEIAKELEEMVMKYCKEAEFMDKFEYKRMYDDIIKSERKHCETIKKEEKFIHDKEYYTDLNPLRLLPLLMFYIKPRI